MPAVKDGYRGRARKSSGEGVDAPAMEDGSEDEEAGEENNGGDRKGKGEP